jgi:hypothetical protein
MSKILNMGTAIIMLGLAAMVATPTFARGNFDRTVVSAPTSAWSHPTVNCHPGYAGPALFHGSAYRKHRVATNTNARCNFTSTSFASVSIARWGLSGR